ncbi:MAG: ATP-dependent helicase [Paenibacillus sp.]|nr:ATP-dependent helicase [Paenibacillus sp.]
MPGSSDFFSRKQNDTGVCLNDVQRQAVLQTEGPLLILASPGSGKTTTIIMRIGYLMEVKGVPPSRIKAVTFSKASAEDMKERFGRFFPELPPPDFSTIHSFAFRVVRDHFRKTGRSYRIIEGELDKDDGKDEQKQERFAADPTPLPMHKKMILRMLFKSIVGEPITDEQLDELTTYISNIKNRMLPPDQWSKVKCDVPEAEHVLSEYETYKRADPNQLLIDYDDMLTIAHDVLRQDRRLLRGHQSGYDYVLADESQDTSAVQHALIEMLVQTHRNVCVVADDDQSIYSWRGADPAYLLDFRKSYPSAKILYMQQNYRSSPQIVTAANQFIKRNKQRYDKTMFTRNPHNEPIQIRRFADYRYQAGYLAREILQIDNKREVAVLYRNNSSSISLMNVFDRAGIPFYMKDADNRFFSHWIVEDVFNFMRMTYTDKRPDLLEKIHTKMNGYITKQQMAELMRIQNNESVFDNLLEHVRIQDYQIKLIAETRDTLREMKGMPPLQAIQVIRRRLGYEYAIDKMCERFGFRKDYLIGILNTLEDIAYTLDTMESFAERVNHLKRLLVTSKHQKEGNRVTLSTFHSAKGLEFDRVYMIDLIEGIIPSAEDTKKKQAAMYDMMEEAARLFYVGMTRARTHLELIAYRERDQKKVNDSLFLTEVGSIIAPKKQESAKKAVPASVANKPSSMKASKLKSEPKPKSSVPKPSEPKPKPSGLKTSGPKPGEPKQAKRIVPTATTPSNPNAIRQKSQLNVGASVKHRVFGTGVIVKNDGEMLEVKFSSSQNRLSVSACLERGLLELT